MKKVLIVSPIECFPDHFGNSARVANIIKYFQEVGIDFKYLHLPDRPFDPQAMLDRVGRNYIYQPYKIRKQVLQTLRYRAIQSLLMRRDHRLVKVDDFVQQSDIFLYRKVLSDYQPDSVIINYVNYSKLFLYTPEGVQKILDTHDSLYLRFRSLYNYGRSINRFRIKLADEISALNRADKVICIQSQEQQFFADNGCESQLVTIGYSIPYCSTPIRTKRFRLLYIGANYVANERAVTNFLKDIWPALLLAFPTVELYIAGSIGTIFHDKYALPAKVKLVGQVADLKTLYEQIDIAINPVQMGSGLKIKNIEALSYGKPVVTTMLGAEGLSEFVGKGLEVIQTPKDWVRILVELLGNTSYYQQSIKFMEEQVRRYNERNLYEMERLFD